LKTILMSKPNFTRKWKPNWEISSPIPTKKFLCQAKTDLVFKTTLSLYYIWLMNRSWNLRR
jgi:hypothetical protein